MSKYHIYLHGKIFLVSDGLIISLALLETIDTWTVTLKIKDEVLEINTLVFDCFIKAPLR